MTDRLGRADLHIHTLASDGTAGVVEILDHVERNTELDVIAITDHERMDAAVAARAMAPPTRRKSSTVRSASAPRPTTIVGRPSASGTTRCSPAFAANPTPSR